VAALLWVNQFALLPGDGGGTRHFELGRELVRKGWNVTILACDLHLHTRRFTRRSFGSDHTTKIETQDGVEIRWLWAAPYQANNWRRALNWLTFYRGVVAEGRRLAVRPDIIIGSSPQLLAAAAAQSLARAANVPFVFEVRDLWPESLVAAGGRRGLAYGFLKLLASKLYRDADRIVVLARGVGEYLVRHGVAAEKIVHIPNGVDVEAMRPPPMIRDDPRRPNHLFKLIYAGAHGPANGLESVLDAANLVGDVHFTLVGDGPNKSALQMDAARRGLANVEFASPVGKQELLRLLHSADAGLMVLKDAPLFSYGVSPNKLFDYLAAGLPVICNVSGDVAGMLGQSGAGIQVLDTRGCALAEGIRVFSKLSAFERRTMGESGRRWVERYHSREVLGRRLDQVLRELVR
jgi:glycosyltransferase involved in cell wall biosynthesis